MSCPLLCYVCGFCGGVWVGSMLGWGGWARGGGRDKGWVRVEGGEL